MIHWIQQGRANVLALRISLTIDLEGDARFINPAIALILQSITVGGV